jgi:CBS domain containing-hemolysin-like protein
VLTALANIGLGVVADAAEIQKQSRTTQHRRILVRGDHHTILGVAHVRDTLRADAASKAGDLMGPVQRLPSDTPVYRALHIMRQTRNHLRWSLPATI